MQDVNSAAAEHSRGTGPVADGVGSSKQTFVSAIYQNIKYINSFRGHAHTTYISVVRCTKAYFYKVILLHAAE